MVLRTRSVHTFGMDTDLLVVALDAGGRVVAADVVTPRAVRVVRGATWIIELPATAPRPDIGAELVLLRRILAR